MRYPLVLATTVATVIHANPVPIPQGVTASLAPSVSVSKGCELSMPSSFGIAVLNATSGAGAVATQTSE